jgi:hypothetical protein
MPLNKLSIHLAVLGILAYTMSSCTGIYVKDNIAHGVNRGYVEFYFTRGDITWPAEYTHMFNSPSIYTVTDDGEIFEGRTVPHPRQKNKEGRRIAKRPENYTFRVWVPVKDEEQAGYHSPQFGIIDTKITVRIKEGYITPVRILVKGSASSGFSLTLIGDKPYMLKY